MLNTIIVMGAMAVAVIVIVMVTMRDSGFDFESLSDFEKCHGDWTS